MLFYAHLSIFRCFCIFKYKNGLNQEDNDRYFSTTMMSINIIMIVSTSVSVLYFWKIILLMSSKIKAAIRIRPFLKH